MFKKVPINFYTPLTTTSIFEFVLNNLIKYELINF